VTYHTLYHGTSPSRLEHILKHGLLPRSEERKGNWKGPLESKDGLVYLSTWMPVYYAANAQEDHDDGFTILKVRVKERDMYPDEDFILPAIARTEKVSLATLRTMHSLHPKKFKKYAADSLRALGSVAVKEVKPKDIIDHRTIPFDMELWSWMGGDTTVSPIAHHINGPKYKHRLELLFSEGIEAVRKDIQAERDEWRMAGLVIPPEPEQEKT
jgi:hypothetical protein